MSFHSFRDNLAQAARHREVDDIMTEMATAAAQGLWEHYFERAVYERMPAEFKEAFAISSQDSLGVTVTWSPGTGNLDAGIEQPK